MNKITTILITFMLLATVSIAGASTETLNLVQKDTNTWVEISGASAVLTYNTVGATFNYNLAGSGLTSSTEYSLIYYKDTTINPTTTQGTVGDVIVSVITDANGNFGISGSKNTGSIPQNDDANKNGAKIWIVKSSDIDGSTLSWVNFANYLFEENINDVPATSTLITYSYTLPSSSTGTATISACPVGTVGVSISPEEMEFGVMYPGEASEVESMLIVTTNGFINNQYCGFAPTNVMISVSASAWEGAIGDNTMPATSTVLTVEEDIFSFDKSYSVPIGESNGLFTLIPPIGTQPDIYTQVITVTLMS